MSIAVHRDEIAVAFSLHRLIRLHERPDLVALEKFNTRDWRKLSLPQLQQLNAILLSRRAAKERAAHAEKQQLKLPF